MDRPGPSRDDNIPMQDLRLEDPEDSEWEDDDEDPAPDEIVPVPAPAPEVSDEEEDADEDEEEEPAAAAGEPGPGPYDVGPQPYLAAARDYHDDPDDEIEPVAPAPLGIFSNPNITPLVKASMFLKHRIERIEFITNNHLLVIAYNMAPRVKYSRVAIRIRTGSAGYSEWLRELQVYRLPGFRHFNIQGYMVAEKRYRLGKFKLPENHQLVESMKSIDLEMLRNHERRYRARRLSVKVGMDHWTVMRYTDIRTLRDFLRSEILSWPQMLFIAKGIAQGLHFLHENGDYTEMEHRKGVDGFLRSTKGAICRVSFPDKSEVVLMEPYISLSVIHRNLSSVNILLTPDLTPKITNFGHAYVQYPFQPINHQELMDEETIAIQKHSVYSPPEVLQEKGHMTLPAMKAIDMYALGIIFWELISRTILPILDPALNHEETIERYAPSHYKEPLEEEFSTNESRTVSSFEYAICRRRARPKLKAGWLAGKITNRYVITMCDLWDADFEARLHTMTVIRRLDEISDDVYDRRYRYPQKLAEAIKKNFEPAAIFIPVHTAPYPRKNKPNIVFHDLEED